MPNEWDQLTKVWCPIGKHIYQTTIENTINATDKRRLFANERRSKGMANFEIPCPSHPRPDQLNPGEKLTETVRDAELPTERASLARIANELEIIRTIFQKFLEREN